MVPNSTHPQATYAAVVASGLLAVLLAGIGCAGGQADEPGPLEIRADAYGRTYEAARRVLRDHGFELDRQDYRFGRITTRPLGSPTIVEIWHGSNSTAAQAAASTINDQRRLVTVMLDPAPKPSDLSAETVEQFTQTEPAAYLLRVEVTIERHQHPQQRLSGSTKPNRLINRLSTVPTELKRRGIEGEYWLPISRDPYLEHRLLTAIVRRSQELANPNN